ncbi:PucR family transcriptional regulator [Peptoniphilus sp. KCTC 25270]|uniref:PucR family transcriptional regulator n=1 Tax=Peptoniphilus sp. KCTC 25270 TaxID=2897414 RepID=UPI001E657715|nr:PucR family transcriptional regulator [Peptoniphilus sp. KCTC 25270]MCD1147419.1 PucR family transcriptional regulator [Peptoniphilus sp. KCTC 25270]
MALTLKKLLQLQHFQEFKCIAGHNGMDRIITSTGILDYEPILDPDMDYEEVFNPNCFVLSSLLFARNNPDSILPTIIELNKSHISAFAFKDILFDQLPQEVIDYANIQNFPIFQFSDTWFENIIFSIMDAVQSENDEILTEGTIKDLIQMKLPPSQVHSLAANLSINYHQYLTCFYIEMKGEKSSYQAENTLKSAHQNKELQQKVLVAKYKKGFFLLITGDSKDQKEYCDAFFNLLPFTKEQLAEIAIVSQSEILPAKGSLSNVIQQSYHGYIGAKVLEKTFCLYDELGTLKFLIPLHKSHEMDEYYRKNMHLLRQERDLFDTAQHFISERGNINKTAEACFCHPNTIRYRLKRIKQLLSLPQDGEHELYEELSTILKLYKLYHVEK